MTSRQRARILVVDDERLVRWGLCKALQEAGYQAEQAANAAEALEAANREVPDAVLLDYRLPDRNGIEVLRKLREIAPRMPVIMITAHASIGGAVEAMKEGVYDYIGKPFEFDDVAQTVARALEAARLREEVAHQREQDMKGAGVDHIVAVSPAMKEVLRLVDRVATSEATTILLLGESGVGKGLIARRLHFQGIGSQRPFMHITCTALTETLLESELFGHEKGAFTDAKAQKKGLFELADGGTIFLDEIGDLSPSLQGKLLRFLEEKTFRRVGGVRNIQVSVRIVAATNKDLKKEVDEGRFRQDLYFRLRVIPILIPPLRERIEDVVPLTEHFIRDFDAQFRKSIQSVDPAVLDLMKAYSWPGNVRELRNAIERAVLLSEGPLLVASVLPPEISGASGASSEAQAEFQLPPGGLVLEQVERSLLKQALEAAKGNKTRAARLLGLNRDQIRYRIEKFGLEGAPVDPS